MWSFFKMADAHYAKAHSELDEDEVSAKQDRPTDKTAEPSVVEIRDLEVQFATESGLVTAVDGISLTVHRGETVALVGESGSGKSVTSLSVMRLVEHGGGRITRGEILLRDREGEVHDLARESDYMLRRMRGADMAMIFQEPMTSLNPVFTVGEQIAESLRLHRKLSEHSAMKETVKLLKLVRIPDAPRIAASYPPSALGRDAPARDDCHGTRVQTRASHCRRTHHCT